MKTINCTLLTSDDGRELIRIEGDTAKVIPAAADVATLRELEEACRVARQAMTPGRPNSGLDFLRLPDDLADAYEQFKLVVLRHRAENWMEVSRDEMRVSLHTLADLVDTVDGE